MKVLEGLKEFQNAELEEKEKENEKDKEKDKETDR